MQNMSKIKLITLINGIVFILGFVLLLLFIKFEINKLNWILWIMGFSFISQIIVETIKKNQKQPVETKEKESKSITSLKTLIIFLFFISSCRISGTIAENNSQKYLKEGENPDKIFVMMFNKSKNEIFPIESDITEKTLATENENNDYSLILPVDEGEFLRERTDDGYCKFKKIKNKENNIIYETIYADEMRKITGQYQITNDNKIIVLYSKQFSINDMGFISLFTITSTILFAIILNVIIFLIKKKKQTKSQL